MNPPRDAIAAATHPDPYPYYAELVARRSLFRDEALGMWVATSAQTVTAVLTSELCRVRPPGKPVPEALLGGPVGDIFGRMIRMNDGVGHCPFKPTMLSVLGAANARLIDVAGESCARVLGEGLGPECEPTLVTELSFKLGVHALASLVGLPRGTWPEVTLWARDLARCFAPTVEREQVSRGHAAAGKLMGRIRRSLDEGGLEAGGGLLAALERATLKVEGADREWVVANVAALFFQVYDGTAGLIGSSILALASQPSARERVAQDASSSHAFVSEVSRWNSPVQNTRRFVARPGMVAGAEMAAGDTILVVVGAANRDPALNPAPERFDLSRQGRRMFSFGAGPHACPGDAIAIGIAAAAIRHVLSKRVDVKRLANDWVYLPSPNVRVPLFGGGSTFA